MGCASTRGQSLGGWGGTARPFCPFSHSHPSPTPRIGRGTSLSSPRLRAGLMGVELGPAPRPRCGLRAPAITPSGSVAPWAPASHRPHLDHVELGHLVLIQAHGQQNVVLLDEHPEGALPAARGLRSAWRRARRGSQCGAAARGPEPCARAGGLAPPDPMPGPATGEAEASPAPPGAASRSEAQR